jgi:hypothetical protein
MDPKKNPPRRRGPSWIELSVALAALVVSGASLYIARQQTAVMHRQLAASVWPALEYSTSNLRGGEPVISISVENVGIGPAHVRSFRASYDGRPLNDIDEFVSECCAEEGTPVRTVTSFLEGRILPAGELVDLLLVPLAGNDTAVYARLNRARAELGVEACYCSVLDECWYTARGLPSPRPVATCEERDVSRARDSR